VVVRDISMERKHLYTTFQMVTWHYTFLTTEDLTYKQKILDHSRKNKCSPVKHMTCENVGSIAVLITRRIFNSTGRRN